MVNKRAEFEMHVQNLTSENEKQMPHFLKSETPHDPTHPSVSLSWCPWLTPLSTYFWVPLTPPAYPLVPMTPLSTLWWPWPLSIPWCPRPHCQPLNAHDPPVYPWVTLTSPSAPWRPWPPCPPLGAPPPPSRVEFPIFLTRPTHYPNPDFLSILGIGAGGGGGGRGGLWPGSNYPLYLYSLPPSSIPFLLSLCRFLSTYFHILPSPPPTVCKSYIFPCFLFLLKRWLEDITKNYVIIQGADNKLGQFLSLKHSLESCPSLVWCNVNKTSLATKYAGRIPNSLQVC